jgi:methyltransferase (TIGR00027 family)
MRNRIEHKISRTAEMNCAIRASSFFEDEPCLKTDDYIAPQLLPKVILLFAKSKVLRAVFTRYFAPAGVYEYVIARTRYIDAVVHDSLKANYNQIVILGAGFDSRAIRFYRPGSDTVFFELDAQITQTAKKEQLQKRKIAIPDEVVFIPIDFSRQSLATRLKEHRFKTTEKTLFILEGITMYLEEEAVHNTFTTIKSISASSSLIVFDFIYKSVLRKEYTLYGEQSLYERVNKYNEAWRFGIEEGRIKEFVEELGLKLRRSSSAEDLEREYHFGPKRINGTHCIVVAEVP